MRIRSFLKPHQIEIALQLRNSPGGPRHRVTDYRKVAKIMGVKEAAVRRAIDPEWVDDPEPLLNRQIDHRGEPTAEMWEERNRRISTEYQSITAAFFGDPKPGYGMDRANGLE